MTRLIDAEPLEKFAQELVENAKVEGARMLGSFLKNMVQLQPSADAVPVRHGKWITEECLPGVAVCSICGHEIRGIGCQYTKYCDECGARMDKDGR